MKGLLLRMPRTGIVAVPIEQTTGGWYCVIVKSDHASYPVGGYNIYVSDAELDAAKVCDVTLEDKEKS